MLQCLDCSAMKLGGGLLLCSVFMLLRRSLSPAPCPPGLRGANGGHIKHSLLVSVYSLIADRPVLLPAALSRSGGLQAAHQAVPPAGPHRPAHLRPGLQS